MTVTGFIDYWYEVGEIVDYPIKTQIQPLSVK